MKLLEKKQISSDFNIQKKLQVDEGVLIAKKVDVLRETLVSLEAQQRNFLAGSRQELINATKDLQTQKSVLEGEITHLEARRRELLKPLDHKWAEVDKAEKDFAKELENFASKEHQLNERESTTKKTEKAIEKDRQQILTLKGEAEKLNAQATENHKISKEIRKQIESDRDNQNRESLAKTKEFTKREEELINQRKYLDLVKANLEDREKTLDDKERFINDKYSTLQRTINRLKQQNE